MNETFRESPRWLRSVRRRRRQFWHDYALRRKGKGRVIPLDEWSQHDYDWAMKRGEELAKEHGW